MIKIPQNGKFSQPNNSDKFGNLWYTKNINLDEEGYIKLSPRAVSLVDSGTDTSFNIPVAFGRQEEDVWHVATVEKNFEIDLSTVTSPGLTAAEDNGTSVPTNAFYSRACWWQNKWHVTDTDDLFYKTISTGNWTDANVTLTASLTHAVEVFRNRNTLCITNGNTVVQVNTSYSTSGISQLTIPADFNATTLAYNNNTMGIGTILSTSGGIVGQNQEAYFFIWDGATSEANAGYAVGSDMIVCLEPYKSSFVLLTRAGELKYFNGGGFDVLATLPIYFKDTNWGDSRNLEAFGDVMVVEGDIIYFNINNANIYQNAPGGVLCYDPKVGIYHRYSPSISPVSMLTVTAANVSGNVLTKTAGTVYATGNPVKYVYDEESANKIGGLDINGVYYIIKLSSSTFSLANTQEEAEAGVAITLTAPSAGESHFMALNLLDFGATDIDRTGAVAIPDSDTGVVNGLIFGGELFPVNAYTNLEYLNFTVSGFENRGYFVTPKIQSTEISDINKKAYIKFRPLRTGEKIILKYKNTDTLGLPLEYKQCTWTGSNSFSTTADFSDIEAYINQNSGECEVEVISGAGAGSMAQIESITEGGGVYSVVLKEDIPGAVGGYLCRVHVDSWKYSSYVDSTNKNGIAEFPIGGSSQWIKIKVEMRGSDIAIEELSFVSQNNKNSV